MGKPEQGLCPKGSGQGRPPTRRTLLLTVARRGFFTGLMRRFFHDTPGRLPLRGMITERHSLQKKSLFSFLIYYWNVLFRKLKDS